MQARKTLLFHEGVPWVKRSGNENFDVPMGSYDGAEVGELVGAFLLINLSHFIDKSNVCLYRDDGLGVFKSHSGPEIERKRKEIIKTFNTYNLSITIEANIRVVKFLDTTFDLINDIYKLYQKPNDSPVYISKEALKKSGLHEKLEYVREEVDKHGKEEKKRRMRKIIWFNPPYSNNVKNNVGKECLKLVRQHFPKGHKLNKIFNNLKVSYSCMRSMSSILTSHNKKILAENEKQYEYNCRNKDDCPLEKKCLTPRVIYEADCITLNTSRKFYILGCLILHLMNVVITISVMRKGVMRKALSFQDIFGACKKVE